MFIGLILRYICPECNDIRWPETYKVGNSWRLGQCMATQKDTSMGQSDCRIIPEKNALGSNGHWLCVAKIVYWTYHFFLRLHIGVFSSYIPFLINYMAQGIEHFSCGIQTYRTVNNLVANDVHVVTASVDIAQYHCIIDQGLPICKKWTSYLPAILRIISKGVSCLATDLPCGVRGLGWTTCLLHDSSFSAHILKWELVCRFGVRFRIFIIISCLVSRFHA